MPLWGWLLALGIGGAFLLHPLDAPIDRWVHAGVVGGDIRREWHALQQYGQATVTAIALLIILLQDPVRRARLWDYALTLLILGPVTFGLKMLVGRPRPVLADPDTFTGPFGVYPLALDGGAKVLARAWDLGGPAGSKLWSMPSSHTAFAVALSVFLSLLYPRLKWIFIVLALIVAGGRLVFDAHWFTDVWVGACVAGAIAHAVCSQNLGVRVFAPRALAGVRAQAGLQSGA
jgi:membrane-associated phospholipid phosphatase